MWGGGSKMATQASPKLAELPPKSADLPSLTTGDAKGPWVAREVSASDPRSAREWST